MNNFIFENKTKVYFGKGCVGEYLPKIAAVHGDKVLLAYGGGSIKKNGVYEEVIAALEKAGKTIIEFPGIMENPTYKKVLEGTKLVKEKQVDWILAVGGGSVMDCSKAISMAAVSEKDVWDEYWAKKGVVDFEPKLMAENSTMNRPVCPLTCFVYSRKVIRLASDATSVPAPPIFTPTSSPR